MINTGWGEKPKSNQYFYTNLVKRQGILLILLLLISFGTSCRRRNNQISIDFPVSGSGVGYASRFTIDVNDSYTRLEIIEPWQGADGVRHVYFLLKEGAILTDSLQSNAIIINVPLKSIVCMSATHVAMISALGMEETIKGVSGIKLIANPSVHNLVKTGLIMEVGYEESLNREAILKMNPDLFMAYGVGSESAGYLAKLGELGIKIMLNAEYLELDPLGKAEWIKVFGALYCLEDKADSIFRAESLRYENVKEIVEASSLPRPKVLLGLPWKDSWYISPGNSYISQLIEDAGGDYLWKESRSQTSMPLSLENVYIKGLNAGFWLNPGSARSLDDIEITDRRLSNLPAFKEGNVYNNTKLLTETGANEYWEKGSTCPGLILKDIALILHPELFPGDTLMYYIKLNRK